MDNPPSSQPKQTTAPGKPDSHMPWIVGLVAAGVVVGLGMSLVTPPMHPLSSALATGAATLLFGGLLGGLVTALFADADRLRMKRVAQVDYLMNVLADLKSVYDQVDRGRTLIAAHKSAKTYGDEMKNLIQARVKLRQVVRALKFDERAAGVAAIGREIECPEGRLWGLVNEMEGYLGRLVNEFEEKHKDISRVQSVYEARMKKALDAAPAAGEVALPDNTPWNMIKALERASDLLVSVDNCDEKAVGASEYCRQFLLPLDEASGLLRKALSAEFERKV